MTRPPPMKPIRSLCVIHSALALLNLLTNGGVMMSGASLVLRAVSRAERAPPAVCAVRRACAGRPRPLSARNRPTWPDPAEAPVQASRTAQEHRTFLFAAERDDQVDLMRRDLRHVL